MKWSKLLLVLIFFVGFTLKLMAQHKVFEEDTTFVPYAEYEESTGNYIIYYLQDAETGEVYKTKYVPPTKINPELSVAVTSDSDNFTYRYSLRNIEDARQGIMSLTLEIKNQFERIDLPSPWFHRNFIPLPYIRITNRTKPLEGWERGDPIQFEEDIEVGDTLRFNVISKYLPTVVTTYALGRAEDISFSFVTSPPAKVYEIRDSLTTKVASDWGIKFKTVGPKELPVNIRNMALVDTLQSYLTFSCDTTWIPNQGVCRNRQLADKLDNVQRQLQRGNTRPAAGSLQALLNELNALREEQISSEAYALLYYNGQFLLEKLRK